MNWKKACKERMEVRRVVADVEEEMVLQLDGFDGSATVD